MENKTVSVIIPAYNARSFIDRCLCSVLNQTYSALQIIAINDGSTDNTLDVLNAYAQKDSRILVIDQDNIGVAATRNVGLENAKGEYILYIDSDDWIERDAIEKLVFGMNEDIDIVFCAFDNAKDGENSEHSASSSTEVWDNGRQLLEFMRHKVMTGMLWNKLIRRSITEGIRFDEAVGYAEDAQFLWAILKKSRNMLVTDEILYHHVLEDSSISHLSFSDNKYTAIPVWEEISREVESNYPQLNDLAKERLLAQAIFSLYEISKCDYNDKEKIKYMKRIIRRNFSYLLKSKGISKKMKLYGLYAML